MKKNLKKKIFGLSLTALVLALPFCSNNIEKVEAESKGECKQYTNYYIFSYVVDLSTNFGKTSPTYPLTKRHNSLFSDALPEGADVDNAQYKWIDLKAGTDGWSMQKYWDMYSKLVKDGLTETAQVHKEGTTWYYTHAKAWFTDQNGEERNDYTDPLNYNLADVVKNSYFYKTTNGSTPLRIRKPAGELILGTVERTIGTDWPAFAQSVRDQHVGDFHPTERHIWLPALLQVKYNAECEDVPTTEKHKVIVKYVDDKTDEELRPQVPVGTYANGEKYGTECPDAIGDEYKLVSTKSLSGTMADEDVTLYCRYSKDGKPAEPDYKVTINYLDKDTKKPIKDPFTHPNRYKNGEKYTAECLDHIGDYIPANHSGNLNGTIENKDVVINCLYTKESVQTSDIPIYIVWAVGGSALAYSIYYFRKYYKAQNNI